MSLKTVIKEEKDLISLTIEGMSKDQFLTLFYALENHETMDGQDLYARIRSAMPQELRVKIW